MVRILSVMKANVFDFSIDLCGVNNLFDQDSFTNHATSTLGDVRDLDKLMEVANRVKPDLVLHLAAQPLVAIGFERPVETFETNGLGTVNVLEVVRRVPSIRGIVVATSDKVYAPSNDIKNENASLGGTDPYSASKGAAEMAVLGYSRMLKDIGKSCMVVRGGNIIGGGDMSEKRLVPDLIRAWKTGSVLDLRLPEGVRPWQHVLDLASSYVDLLSLISASEVCHHEAFNVGPNVSQKRKSVTQLIQEFHSQDVRVDCVERNETSARFHEADVLEIDSQKLERFGASGNRLGFEKVVSWTAEWYREVILSKVLADEITLRQIYRYLELRPTQIQEAG